MKKGGRCNKEHLHGTKNNNDIKIFAFLPEVCNLKNSADSIKNIALFPNS